MGQSCKRQLKAESGLKFNEFGQPNRTISGKSYVKETRLGREEPLIEMRPTNGVKLSMVYV